MTIPKMIDKSRIISIFLASITGLLPLIVYSSAVHASKCPTTAINPLNDISWQCVFPIRVGGVVQLGPNQSEQDDKTQNTICVCNGGSLPRIGITVSLWEPARIIDTVSEPCCMMPLGTNINPSEGMKLSGSLGRTGNQSKAFQQVHYYQFPAWAVLDLFTDIPCLEETEFDVAMMTEVLPTWNNEILAAVVNPEAVLFGNPAAALACAADSAGALVNKPSNELFWCMGSWGNTYPLSGSITATDYVAANAGLAARSIYLMGRMGLLKDTAYDGCSFGFTPIWRKNRYKLQLMKPVKDNECQSIGKSGLLWTNGKHPAVDGDNFSWMMFRKVNCCVTYN